MKQPNKQTKIDEDQMKSETDTQEANEYLHLDQVKIKSLTGLHLSIDLNQIIFWSSSDTNMHLGVVTISLNITTA